MNPVYRKGSVGVQFGRSSTTRREFAQWVLSASALWLAPGALGQRVDAAMLLDAGDARHLRLRRRGAFSDGAAGSALRWRIFGDEAAAEAALAGLWERIAAVSIAGWGEAAELALAADWLANSAAFDAARKKRAAEMFLAAAESALASSQMTPPEQTAYQNVVMRTFAFGLFTFTAAARLRPGEGKLAEVRTRFEAAQRDVLRQTQFMTPDGSSAESMDYMRIANMPLVMMAELQRSLTGVDPARRFSVFRNLGETYRYKLLPDGTPSREGDNEYPLLMPSDNVVLGYAVHRFRDGHAAWLLRRSGYAAKTWEIPVLQALWDEPEVAESEAHGEPGRTYAKHFRGVDQVVFQTGFGAPFGENDTRIEFDCGPYFEKHQHLDRGHFTIHHRGHLAIDSGADYTNSESPHYLNYYRRTVAHNTMLVFDPEEKFFWGEKRVAAANDGGQRMDSPRFWNSMRSVEDWDATRQLWDLGHLRVVDAENSEAARYQYALGDATRAYSPKKLEKFTRELLYLPRQNVLVVFDDVRATSAEFRKTWLLHTVEEPEFSGAAEALNGNGVSVAGALQSVRVVHEQGEMTVHTVLPIERSVLKRGGPGHEFWTPGDSVGGGWGSGRNWPLTPAEGGPLPDDAEERELWKQMYGADFKHIERSNRVNVIPGSWRIEVTPRDAAMSDVFLHVFEIGSRGKTGSMGMLPIRSAGVEGAVCGRTAVIFLKEEGLDRRETEFVLPGAVDSLWLRGIAAGREFEVAGAGVLKGRANAHGVAMVEGAMEGGSRLTIR